MLTAIATDSSGLATTSAAVQINEGSLHTFTVTASDPDSSVLTFSLVGAPEGAAIDARTGVFAWTAAEAQGTVSYGFTVRVTDDGTADRVVTVSVQEVNEPPALAALSDRTVNEATPMTALASATDPDLPANGLAYTLLSGPTGAVIGTTGSVSWTPAEADGPGSHVFTVRVTDNASPALSATTSFTVTVGEGNQAPVLAALSNRTTTEGSTLAFTASASSARRRGRPSTRPRAHSPGRRASGTWAHTRSQSDGPKKGRRPRRARRASP